MHLKMVLLSHMEDGKNDLLFPNFLFAVNQIYVLIQRIPTNSFANAIHEAERYSISGGRIKMWSCSNGPAI